MRTPPAIIWAAKIARPAQRKAQQGRTNGGFAQNGYFNEEWREKRACIEFAQTLTAKTVLFALQGKRSQLDWSKK